jgi:hypothetical protein
MSASLPFKKSNVNYSNNTYCKTLSLPLITTSFQFGTAMQDPIWKYAVSANDFTPFSSHGKALEKGSEFAVFCTETHFVIGMFFYEDPANFIRQPNQHSSVWSGDMVELHFGSMEPDPWLYQTGL